jgi:hypothetical protein
LNYAGKFGSSGLDSISNSHVDLDQLSHRGDTDAITVPDAHLLFSGDYHKSGSDLIISDHLHRVVVPNYFHGDKHPTLVSPDGAPIDPKVIDALAGHTEYAQAGGSPAPKVVGHVAKMTGSASVVRNGVTVDVQNGDAVYQSDVVQTGSGSTLGLVLNDGTTFNLSAGARLMLNDLTYDASSTSNSALFTLVQGAASFVAGQVARTGDMKIGTPVATMGIRGTVVVLDIDAIDGRVSISVVDQRDGQLHAVQVFNARGDLIGTVTSNGSMLTLTPTATFEATRHPRRSRRSSPRSSRYWTSTTPRKRSSRICRHTRIMAVATTPIRRRRDMRAVRRPIRPTRNRLLRRIPRVPSIRTVARRSKSSCSAQRPPRLPERHQPRLRPTFPRRRACRWLRWRRRQRRSW